MISIISTTDLALSQMSGLGSLLVCRGYGVVVITSDPERRSQCAKISGRGFESHSPAYVFPPSIIIQASAVSDKGKLFKMLCFFAYF